MPDRLQAPPAAALPILTEVLRPIGDGLACRESAPPVPTEAFSGPSAEARPSAAPAKFAEAERPAELAPAVETDALDPVHLPESSDPGAVFAALEARMVEVLDLELERVRRRLLDELQRMRAHGLDPARDALREAEIPPQAPARPDASKG
jgi:hypothetical protein